MGQSLVKFAQKPTVRNTPADRLGDEFPSEQVKVDYAKLSCCEKAAAAGGYDEE